MVAPDLPGFGLSSLPSSDQGYTVSWILDIIEDWLAQIGVTDKVLYLHAYGTAVGYYLATRSPYSVRGLIIQNSNAHPEGLGGQWDVCRDYWAEPTEENKKRIEPRLDYEDTKHQYLWNLPDRLAVLVPPETSELDWLSISRGHGLEAQWELFTDYRTHIARFPVIQDYYRIEQLPTLIIWGVHDPYYDIDEVLVYHRDLPAAQSHPVDAGHYLPETHSREALAYIKPFNARLTVQR